MNFAAMNALSIVAPSHTSAYTYPAAVSEPGYHKLELSWTPYLGKTLINCELHPWNLMPVYEQKTSFLSTAFKIIYNNN